MFIFILLIILFDYFQFASFVLEDGRILRIQPDYKHSKYHELMIISNANNNSVDDEHVPKIRTRRAISTNNHDIYSRIFTIETIIFVDHSLIQKFNGNVREVERVVLAIMNEVQMIYNFDSMKIRIRILIKKIVYLDQASRDIPSPAGGDIDLYLDNFCAWQKRLWNRANSTMKWDHALMLTGMDLYKKLAPGRKNSKVLGLAWVNGMCRPAYSCTLNEGKNFE